MYRAAYKFLAIAVASDALDIYRVMEEMGRRRWSLNGLHHPAAFHIALTLHHTRPGVAERFLEDLQAAVTHVREHPEERGQMAPVDGMVAALPFRGTVRELLKRYVDLLYRV